MSELDRTTKENIAGSSSRHYNSTAEANGRENATGDLELESMGGEATSAGWANSDAEFDVQTSCFTA